MAEHFCVGRVEVRVGSVGCLQERRSKMRDWQTIWLALLTLALVAHMIKDAMEFKKIKKLEEEVGELKRR